MLSLFRARAGEGQQSQVDRQGRAQRDGLSNRSRSAVDVVGVGQTRGETRRNVASSSTP